MFDKLEELNKKELLEKKDCQDSGSKEQEKIECLKTQKNGANHEKDEKEQPADR